MESINELSNLIRQKYNVTQETKTKRGMNLEAKEFNDFGVHTLVLEIFTNKGLGLTFASNEAQANFLADNIDLDQGSTRLNSRVWKYLNSEAEARDLLESILKFSRKYPAHHVKELEEEFNRLEIEKSALSEMSLIDRTKYEGFWEIAKKLNSNLGSIFHVDHATSIKQGREAAIVYTNLQILVKGINSSKNENSWERFTYEQQCEHILSCARVIPHADDDYIDLLINQLELYWG